MMKACFWTLSLAPVVALTIAVATGAAMAQTRTDSPVATAGSSPLQGAALRFDAPTQPDAPSQPPGGLPGMGPMQASPLLGAHPLQTGGGKW